MTEKPITQADIHAAGVAAAQAWRAARYSAWSPRSTIDRVWSHFTQKAVTVTDPAARLQVAQSALAAMTALATLPHQHMRALCDEPDFSRTMHLAGRDAAEARRRHFREAMQSREILADVLAAWDAEAAAVEKRAAALVASREEQQRQNAPRALLESLQKRHIALQIDKSGNLLVPSGAGLTADDVAVIVQFKFEIVALLRAQAAAQQPVLVA